MKTATQIHWRTRCTWLLSTIGWMLAAIIFACAVWTLLLTENTELLWRK